MVSCIKVVKVFLVVGGFRRTGQVVNVHSTHATEEAANKAIDKAYDKNPECGALWVQESTREDYSYVVE